jgi:serine/threonine protein kinase
VQTLDVVASAEELLLVMEYVLGETLAQLIKRTRSAGRLTPIPVVVDVVTGLLNGLQAAHVATNENGEPLNVVHRDVSPHNILVGADGVTRVLDFGIAQAIGHMHQSRSGEVKGKIRYMPPEQFSGQDVGRAADIYAASVVLWEALTCSRLFGRGSDGEVISRMLEGNIPPPSNVRPDVPQALDEIVLRGLKSNPAQRYQTAKAMADALEDVAPPVTRSTVSNWVLESAGDDIRRRQECLARVESSITPSSVSPPAPAAPASEPSAEATTADSTLSSAGSLSQSVTPGAPSAAARWPRRKRLVLVAGAAVAVALAGLTPPLFLRSSEARDEHKAASVSDRAANAAPALAAMPAENAIRTAAPSASSAAVAASAMAAPAASSAMPAPSAVSEPVPASGKRATPTITVKRPRAKDGSFDRIYRRD